MKRIAVSLAVAAALAACQQPDLRNQQKAALTLSAESLAQRQMQSRRYDTRDETMILAAAAGVLQDLGFNIDESSPATGLIVASKDRDAIEAGQATGAVLLTMLIAASGGKGSVAFDTQQKIRISVVTKQVPDGILVRTTFQRVVWNSAGQVSRTESLGDAAMYQQFYDKLSQSVFLEGHAI
ncbi:hypothetical protein [Magnetospirillum sp. UT-4]|uniref:hypothetical protein n=1 Tax=Magnetospirillum sp. UT-4 TaxID=2681467 RepID=UPI00138575E6|nr:hypothetical protein [Magnetospirillum sp. UT-4]CAA7626457.1 conserved exported hypothetical protein [Magnetospirillum sp. UT-4]